MNRDKIISIAWSMIGRPYLLGAKWDINDPNPKGPIDCSGFVRWCYFQGAGITMPDGSYNQFAVTDVEIMPLIADLGFFKDSKGEIDHVGLIADAANMIEARGSPYNAVILRPRSKWEAWPLFTGYRRLRGI